VVEAISEGFVAMPAPSLRPLIARYMGYRMEGFPPALHRGLPSQSMTFIVSLHDPVDLLRAPGHAHPLSLDAFVSGLHETNALIQHDGTQIGVSIDLTPFGTRALLGMPASALAGTVAPLDTVLGPRAGELVDRLRAAESWTDRFAVLDDVLARRVEHDATAPTDVVWAWDRLVASGGLVEVRTLARELGWSPRHFGERFRCELGIAPKVAARVLRFGRSRRMMQGDTSRSLSDVAAACGFYDQAHLAREWRALAGCPPSQWIAEELSFVQGTDAAVSA
jgi:AraC-like DNA-binding protein